MKGIQFEVWADGKLVEGGFFSQDNAEQTADELRKHRTYRRVSVLKTTLADRNRRSKLGK